MQVLHYTKTGVGMCTLMSICNIHISWCHGSCLCWSVHWIGSCNQCCFGLLSLHIVAKFCCQKYAEQIVSWPFSFLLFTSVISTTLIAFSFLFQFFCSCQSESHLSPLLVYPFFSALPVGLSIGSPIVSSFGILKSLHQLTMFSPLHAFWYACLVLFFYSFVVTFLIFF